MGKIPIKNPSSNVENLEDFAIQNASAKSHIQTLIAHIARETNRHKLGYGQLRYVFRCVRLKCRIEIPDEKSRKLYELPNEEEIARFFSVIENPMHRLIFETLEQTGLRLAELCALTVDRIDFKTNIAFVSQGKGKKDRCVIFGTHLLEKLRIYLDGRKNKWLYESNRHKKFSNRRIEQICAKYRRLAGIEKDLTPHTFRHLMFSRLAAANISKEKRMILAGHASEKVQDIYTTLGVGGVRDEVLAILDRWRR